MAGVSLGELTAADESSVRRPRVVLSAIAFVLGFSTIFVALGVSAGAFGDFVKGALGILYSYGVVIPFIVRAGQPVTIPLITLIPALLIIAMGLHFLGILRIPVLNREFRFRCVDKVRVPVGSYVMGLAFAFGWTPCIGPVLAAILAVAGTEATVGRGASAARGLLAGARHPVHRRGFSPGRSCGSCAAFRAYLGAVEKTMGGLLVVTGVLFITGRIADVSYWLLDNFPGPRPDRLRPNRHDRRRRDRREA